MTNPLFSSIASKESIATKIIKKSSSFVGSNIGSIASIAIVALAAFTILNIFNSDLPEKAPRRIQPSLDHKASAKSFKRCEYASRLLSLRPSVPVENIPPHSVVEARTKPHCSAPSGRIKKSYSPRPDMRPILEEGGIKSRFTVLDEE